MNNPKSKDYEFPEAAEMGELAALILKAAEQSGSALSMARKFYDILEPYRAAAYEQGAKDMRKMAALEAEKCGIARGLVSSPDGFCKGWCAATRRVVDEIEALPLTNTAGRTEGMKPRNHTTTAIDRPNHNTGE